LQVYLVFLKMNREIWVIKIGSALLTDNGKGLDKAAIAKWTEQMAFLKKNSIDCILVSSGAIAEGMQRMRWSSRPSNIHELQAAAAIGQMGLVQTYESLFSQFGIHTAQILLTHENLQGGKTLDNVRSTIHTLLSLGVVPIVNENDTVATEEIKFGDNDTLAARVSNLINAKRLIILTDQGGVYDSDPRENTSAKLISKIQANDELLEKVASRKGGSLGSGGMYTKVLAARTACDSGTETIIASGHMDSVLIKLFEKEKIGTLIHC